MSEIIIYKSADNQSQVEVTFDKETVWLNQAQIVQLFQRDQSVISKHITNVFKEELDKKSNMHFLHIANSDKPIAYYSLDVIISVGYRVKSKQGTQFRIWANSVLKNYLVNGYALNEKRLQAQKQHLADIQQTIKLVQSVSTTVDLSADEANGLLKVITDYTLALDLLDQYDHERLIIVDTESSQKFTITLEEAYHAIDTLRLKFSASELFGREKDDSFKSSIGTIYQTFDGIELYPSVEEKAAQLLYFVVKNHSFTDGNKRIAAFLFVWFLERNAILYKPDGGKRLADNALVALTLLIAESKSEEMDTIIKVVVNLINCKN